jgi:hypothetical protein
MAACGKREHYNNGIHLRNENSEPVSIPEDGTRQIQRTVRQQVCDVTELHQTLNWIDRMLEAHAVHKQVQCLGIKEWVEDWQTKWNDHNNDNVI